MNIKTNYTLKEVIHSILDLDNNNFEVRAPLEDLCEDIEPIDLLPIFYKRGLPPTTLRPYITEDSLTEKGREFLIEVSKHSHLISEDREYPKYLSESDSLDHFARDVRTQDLININNYLRGILKN